MKLFSLQSLQPSKRLKEPSNRNHLQHRLLHLGSQVAYQNDSSTKSRVLKEFLDLFELKRIGLLKVKVQSQKHKVSK